MKYEYLLKKLKGIEIDGGYGVQDFFDKEYEGDCPCFEGTKKVDGKNIKVWGRCWRVSKNAQDLNIWSQLGKEETKLISESIKKCLDAQKWHNSYTIIYHKKDWLLPTPTSKEE